MNTQNELLGDQVGPDDELMSSFPSAAFLEKYFIEDMLLTSPPTHGNRSQLLYHFIREQFFFGLVYAPYILIREEDWLAGGVSHKYAFEHGLLSAHSKFILEDRLVYEPTMPQVEVYEQELFNEMKAQFELGRLRNIDPWWEWFATEDSIGVRLTPDANPKGGNRPKRTLKEILTNDF